MPRVGRAGADRCERRLQGYGARGLTGEDGSGVEPKALVGESALAHGDTPALVGRVAYVLGIDHVDDILSDVRR